MIKNILTITVLYVITCMAAASAQSVGTWQHINSYGGDPTKILDTPEKVFAVSQNRLTVYTKDDKGWDELTVYSTNNYLTDAKVTDVYYNYDKRYENGNLDIVYDDGRTVNMPEIRDLELNSEKRIRQVWFKGDRIYLACEFGLVVMDDEKYHVIESVMSSSALIAAFELDDQLILCDGSYGMYQSPANVRHYSMSQFNHFSGGGHEAVAVIDDRRYYTVVGDELFLFTMNDDFTGYSNQKFPVNGIKGKFCPLKSGGYFIYGSNAIAYCGMDGNVSVYPIPETLSGNPLACYADNSHLWTATEYGISEYGYDVNSGELTALKQDYRPQGLSCGNVGHIHKGARGIYFSSASPSNPYVISENTRSFIDYQPYGALGYENIYPKELPHTNNSFPSPKNLMHSNYRITEIPGEPETFLVGNFFEGMYKMNTKGEVLGKYDYTNSSINLRSNGYLNGVTAQAFDRGGNLWVMAFGSSNPFFHMLPADKVKADKTVIADWNPINLGDFAGFKDGGMLVCQKSNMIFLGGMYGIVGYDTKGTYTNLSDDEYSYRLKFTDQDGLSLESYYYIPMAEDQNGKVWIGHDGGVR